MFPSRTAILAMVVAGGSVVLAAGCRPAATPAVAAPAPADPGWFEDVTDKVGLDFVHDAGPLGRLLLHAADHRLRRRSVRLRQRRPARHSAPPERRPPIVLQKQAVQAASGRPIPGRQRRLRPRLRRLEHGRGDRRRGQRRLARRAHHPVRRRQTVPQQQRRRHVHGRDERGRPGRTWVVPRRPPSSITTATGGSTSSSSATSITTRPCPAPGRVGRRTIATRKRSTASPPCCYHNVTGADGRPRFEDVTAASGLGRLPGPGLGVICADFDGDGWPDIFVANDGQPNRLWINQKDGTFKDEAVRRGVAYDGMGMAQAGMGVALGDVDGDGLEDLFVTHLGEETNTLWVQGPRGLFRDRTGALGPGGAALARHRVRDGAGRLRPGRRPGHRRGQRPRASGRGGAARGGRVGAVLVGLRGAQPVVRGRRQGRFRDLSPAQPDAVRPAERRPRPGRRRRERRRGAGPAGDDGRRAGAAAAQPGAQPRPLAGGAALRSGPGPRRGRRRGHGAGRRPALAAAGRPGRQLPVQRRPAGLVRPGFGGGGGLGRGTLARRLREEFVRGPADRLVDRLVVLRKGQGRPAAAEGRGG